MIDRKVAVISDMHKTAPQSCVIDLGEPDVLDIIKQMLSCDFIISSSLHGLIAADALGIPNVWMRVSANVYGGDWKFLDYFSSVGRTETEPLALTGAAPGLTGLENTAARTDKTLVENRQKDLEKSFASIGW